MIDITEAKKFWPETCHGRWMDPDYEEGLVSVIIPTYNRAHFITDAMDSVWNQVRLELHCCQRSSSGGGRPPLG